MTDKKLLKIREEQDRPFKGRPRRFCVSFRQKTYIENWKEIVPEIKSLSGGDDLINGHSAWVHTREEAQIIVLMLYEHVQQVIDWEPTSPEFLFMRQGAMGTGKGSVILNAFND